MDITREEARRSLEDIQDAAERTRKMAAYAGADLCFIIWGVVWVAGFLATHFIPPAFGYRPVVGILVSSIWSVLVVTGIVSTVLITRGRTAVRTRADSRMGWLWWLFYMYIWIWFLLLSPFIEVRGHEQSQMFWRHVGALSATIPMFMYTVMGLWLDMYMLWLGLFVTALTLAGLYLLPSVFYIWMAAAGGGTLIATGLLVRNRWR